jgi:hypothetical protein
VPPAAIKKNPTTHKQPAGSKSEICGPTIRHIDLTAVGQIKGIPIHSLEGSCSGYRLIPYFRQSNVPSRRYINPAALKNLHPDCATARNVLESH